MHRGGSLRTIVSCVSLVIRYLNCPDPSESVPDTDLWTIITWICLDKFAALGKLAKKLIGVGIALRMNWLKNDRAFNVLDDAINRIADHLIDSGFEKVLIEWHLSFWNAASDVRSKGRSSTPVTPANTQRQRMANWSDAFMVARSGALLCGCSFRRDNVER
jgi:hypothetical protein